MTATADGFVEASSEDNLRGAGWMMISMAGYTVNDAIIKLAAEDLPLFQSIFLRGVAVCLILFAFCVHKGVANSMTRHIRGPVVVRMFCEMAGTIFFLIALTKVPLAPLTVVMQVVPLAVTVVAARLLHERVDISRWIAVVVGLLGVGFVVRPGTDDFSPWLLLGFGAVVTVVARELATRRVADDVPSAVVSLGTGVLIMLMGAIVSIFQGWGPVGGRDLALLAAAGVSLSIGYVASVITIRTGDVSFSAPFRYTVLIMAIVLQIVVFRDVPDLLTFVGSVIVAAAGLYALVANRSALKTAPGQ